MAKLTDTINTVDSGKRIVGAPEGYSFLGGLANAASGLAHSYAVGDARAQEQKDKDVSNEFATGIFNLRSSAEDTMRSGGHPTDMQPQGGASNEETLPPDLSRAAEEIAKTKRAVSQGRATQDALDLKTERFVSDLYAKHPDRTDLLHRLAKEAGVEHYMFRQGEYQSQVEDAENLGIAEGRNQSIQLATSLGYTGSPDQLFQIGAQKKQESILAEQMKDAAAAARAAKDGDQKDYEFAHKKAADAAYNLYSARLTTDMGVVLDQFNQLVATAGDSPENYAELQKVGGQLSQYGQTYITHLENQLAQDQVDPETHKRIMDDAQHRIQAFKEVLSGPSDRLAQTTKSLQYFQNVLGLKAYDALPYYNYLKTAFGSQAAVDSIFGAGGQVVLSDELTSKARGEIKNFDPTKKNEAFHILQEIGLLARGDKNLADVPEGRVTGDYVRSLAQVSRGTALAILDPHPDKPEEIKGFLGAHGNMIVATDSIQQGYKDQNGWAYAVNALTGKEQTAVFDSLIHSGGVFKAQAATTFQANRAAVGRLLEIGHDLVPSPPGQGIKVQNGQYVAFNENKLRITKGPDAGMEMGGGQAEVSASLKRQAADMNRAVDYLVNTAQADPSLKGVSPQELRQHYLTGTPLPKKEGEQAVKAAPDWAKSAAELERALTDRITHIPEDHPLRGNVAFKDDRDAAIRTAIGEAGGEGVTGMKAVMGVIRNRVQQSGLTVQDVVTRPKQFTAVETRLAELLAIPEDDPRYQAAAAAWDAGPDASNQYTHFYAPTLQAKNGDPKPKWDDGTGTKIGNHIFFKHGYKG